MIKLSPAEMAVVKAWYEYLHSHKPNIHHDNEHEEDNDIIRRGLLVYLMTEIMYDYYKAQDVHWPSYTTHRMMKTDSGTLSRWREKWQKVWTNLRLK